MRVVDRKTVKRVLLFVMTQQETLSIAKCAALSDSDTPEQVIATCNNLTGNFQQDFLLCLAQIAQGNGVTVKQIATDARNKLQQLALRHNVQLAEPKTDPPKPNQRARAVHNKRAGIYQKLFNEYTTEVSGAFTEANGKLQLATAVRKSHSTAVAIADILHDALDNDFELGEGISFSDPDVPTEG